MPNVTDLQNRCQYLSYRCYTGFDRRDKEKKIPIQESKAVFEWEELLDKRFMQSAAGGKSFVVEIANIVKNKKTPKGLDLSGRKATLELLSKWCKGKCEELNINPGSECMVAMNQITQKMDMHHEENMEVHAKTHSLTEEEVGAMGLENSFCIFVAKIGEAPQEVHVTPTTTVAEIKVQKDLKGYVCCFKGNRKDGDTMTTLGIQSGNTIKVFKT